MGSSWHSFKIQLLQESFYNNMMLDDHCCAFTNYFIEGQIPMRHLVYRVQALSQSLLPLVWDFGTLKSAPPQEDGQPQPGDVETRYIEQMIVKFVSYWHMGNRQ